jgi:mannose/fructose-specific phosphotransferase system component IIA
MIPAILTGHGEFPFALYSSVKKILGEQENFYLLSNENCSLEELKRRLKLIIDSLPDNEVIIFVDLLGGSCGIASRQITPYCTKKIGIMSGVTLGTLIRYFQYRNHYDLKTLLVNLVEAAHKDIVLILPE